MAEHYSGEDSTKTCMAEYNDARANNRILTRERVLPPDLTQANLIFDVKNVMPNSIFIVVIWISITWRSCTTVIVARKVS